MSYIGPPQLHEDLASALDYLHAHVQFNLDNHATHSVLEFTGLQDPECITAQAVYLVGVVASSIQFNLRINEALFNADSVSEDLTANVRAIIRDSNAEPAEWKRDVRNPWIWECLAHLLLHLSRWDVGRHPPGEIVAMTTPHLNATDRGLDFLAIYRSAPLGISVGECKAYLDDPGRAITDAADILAEVDGDERDMEIRQLITRIRPALPAEIQDQLSGAFWRDERCYFPMVCCELAYAASWDRSRPKLNRLEPLPHRKIILPHSLDGALGFFDQLSDAMRNYCALAA